MPKCHKVTVPQITKSMNPAREAVRKSAAIIHNMPNSQMNFTKLFLAVTKKARAKGSDSTIAKARSFGLE